MTSMYDAAAWWASVGFQIIPLKPHSKIPATRHGKDDATGDPDQIRRWFTDNPDANIGARPAPKLLVIDIDPRNGGDQEWEDLTHGRQLPDTLTVTTGSSGAHIWYQLPHPGPLRGKYGHGIDLKTHTGYLVMPPSIHPCGGQYKITRWAPIAPLPDFLTTVVYKPEHRPQKRHTFPRTGTGDRAAGLIRTVESAQVGNRNHALFWAACRAYEDDLNLDERLSEAAEHAGLDATEVTTTLHSARQTIEHGERSA